MKNASALSSIVLILLDDLGFNDVGFHGSTQIPTPHMDEIAKTGVTLNNYHAQPVCSPTRASLMSGRHAIHHGIYMPFSQGSALRLNLSYTLLPAALKKLGYETHMVGKWHLGQNVLAALPTGRGYDSYYGYWSGAEDYILHDTHGAYDFADGTKTCFADNNTYSTYLFAKRAVDVIEHAKSPFFLYLAWQNVHWPLEAPDAYVQRFAATTGNDTRRQHVAAMANIADEGIGNVTSALKRRGLWDSTHLVLLSDNGGPTNGNEGTWSSNFPMRGGKNTLWEGGTRVVAAMRGPAIGAHLVGTVSQRFVHVTDWFFTLTALASAQAGVDRRTLVADNEPPYLDGDGMDVSKTLATGVAVRKETLLECHAPPASWHTYLKRTGQPFEHVEGYLPVGDDDWTPHQASVGACLNACSASSACAAVTFVDDDASPSNGTSVKCYGKRHARHVVPRGMDQVHGDALIVGEWKYLHFGPTHPKEEAGWVPPPGQTPSEQSYQLGCDLSKQPASVNLTECVHAPCLFHVASDPCEYTDLARQHPEIVAQITHRLAALKASAVPPLDVADCGCSPVITDGAWRPCDAPDPHAEDGMVESPSSPTTANEDEAAPTVASAVAAPSAAYGPRAYMYGRAEWQWAVPPSAPA